MLLAKPPPNNPLNRSGISLSLIVNLSHDVVVSRPVNSGARWLLFDERLNCKLMSKVRTKISVAGFNTEEIAEGFQDFLAEFKERPWLINPRAEWDSGRSLLLVTIETEGDNPKLESDGVLDEVWDCVQAYFSFSSERISFDILEVELIS